VVINNILNSTELIDMKEAFGEDLLNLLDHKAVGDSAHTDVSVQIAYKAVISNPKANVPMNWPGILTKASVRGLPQGKFAWKMRTHGTLKRIFQSLYQDFDIKKFPNVISNIHQSTGSSEQQNESTVTESKVDDISSSSQTASSCHRCATTDNTSLVPELVVGLDVPFFAPKQSKFTSEYNGFKRDMIWGHSDQNSNIDNCTWPCYQSVLSIEPTMTKHDWTTVIMPGSHKSIWPLLDVAAVNYKKYKHFTPIKIMADNRINAQYLYEAKRIPLPAGSLIIWNSKTIHQGWNGGQRLAMPVCWEPKALRSKQAYNRKLRIVCSGLATTHWASFGYQHDWPDNLPNAPSVGNGNLFKVELPVIGKIRPHALKQDVDFDHVLQVCSKAKQANDLSDEYAQQLQTFLIPEILNIL
jgi:hypothetical protein